MIFHKYSFTRYPNRLLEWATPRMKSQYGYDFLRELFAYDPDKRLTAKKALQHKWFEEDPKPTRKYVKMNTYGPCLLTFSAHNTAHSMVSCTTTFHRSDESRTMTRLLCYLYPPSPPLLPFKHPSLRLRVRHKWPGSPRAKAAQLVLGVREEAAAGR